LFFGRLIAWPRWHANAIVLNSLPVHVSLQRFPSGRAAFGLLLLLSLNAAYWNASFASEPPGLREKLKTYRFLYAFPAPLHPVNSDRALHNR
jgi:hypothetical protein